MVVNHTKKAYLLKLHHFKHSVTIETFELTNRMVLALLTLLSLFCKLFEFFELQAPLFHHQLCAHRSSQPVEEWRTKKLY